LCDRDNWRDVGQTEAEVRPDRGGVTTSDLSASINFDATNRETALLPGEAAVRSDECLLDYSKHSGRSGSGARSSDLFCF